jgi:hypothetical protein
VVLVLVRIDGVPIHSQNLLIFIHFKNVFVLVRHQFSPTLILLSKHSKKSKGVQKSPPVKWSYKPIYAPKILISQINSKADPFFPSLHLNVIFIYKLWDLPKSIEISKAKKRVKI